MTLHTPLCDLLEIQHPIMQAGMGGVAYAELVAAVCEAGGYGVLGMAGRTPEFIRDEMRKVSWPSFPEVRRYSIIVLVAVVIVTTYVFGLDSVFGVLSGWLYKD